MGAGESLFKLYMTEGFFLEMNRNMLLKKKSFNTFLKVFCFRFNSLGKWGGGGGGFYLHSIVCFADVQSP